MGGKPNHPPETALETALLTIGSSRPRYGSVSPSVNRRDCGGAACDILRTIHSARFPTMSAISLRDVRFGERTSTPRSGSSAISIVFFRRALRITVYSIVAPLNFMLDFSAFRVGINVLYSTT